MNTLVLGLEEMMANPTSAGQYARLLLKIAENCSSDEGVLKFVFSKILTIVGLGECVTSSGVASRAGLFKRPDGGPPESSFWTAMSSQDNELKRLASRCLAYMLAEIPGGNVTQFAVWLADEFQSEGARDAVTAMVPAVCIMFQNDSARATFRASGGLDGLVKVMGAIGANGNAQQLYELSFCLWILSLSLEDGPEVKAFLTSGSITIAADLIAAAPSRKVVRVIMAFLRNLAVGEDPLVLTEMFALGIQRYLEGMMHSNALKQANDAEFESDARELYSILMKNVRDLSTFDCWAAEVSSGKLRWGMVHTEKFWRENARFLERDDFKLLKCLIKLLAEAADEATMCICLFDIGEFTRFYSGGRGITKTLGGKDVAMALIDHKNAEVSRHALQCVSKIMVTNWEFMQ